MARGGHGEITGDARKLFRVPKDALVDALLKTALEPLNWAFQQVVGNKNEASKSSLVELTHSDLIRVFRLCPSIAADDIRRLHDEFRYRGMKSLYLYEYSELATPLDVNTEALNGALSEVLSKQKKAAADYQFARLHFHQSDDSDEAAPPLVELPYSYVAALQVIDPETEYPTLARDLRTGFVWLHPDEQWMAICARDEAISRILASTLKQSLGCNVRVLHIPKSALQLLEPSERIRRVSFFDPRTGTRRRLTNPNMANDDDAMDEFRLRDQQDERPASGYTQTLPDKSRFALGYSNERGMIFFSRDLTVTQMRNWAPEKIKEIVSTICDLRAQKPVDFVKVASSQVLKRMHKATKEVVEELARAVVVCRTANLSETDLEFDSIACSEALGTRVDVHFWVDCATCQEPTEIRCESCAEIATTVHNQQLVCSACGQVVDLQRVECSLGHRNVVLSMADLVHLVPLSNLRASISNLMKEVTDRALNESEESFHIRGKRLFFSSTIDKIVYTIDDLPEMATLLPSDRPLKNDEAKIRATLGEFKEKCQHMSVENCAACVASPRSRKCFLRLFGLYDPGYTPRPHEGHEYGDYSRVVIVDGQQKQLVVAIKSSKPSSRPLRLRDPKGRDIYSQVGEYLRDSTKEIIGICVPRKIADGFLSVLRSNAHKSHKNLLFLDDEDLCRIIYGVMRKRGLSLGDV